MKVAMTEAIKKVLADDLYVILEASNNEELAPIVRVLEGSPVSNLKFMREYTRHSPDHLKYGGQVGDEIYRFGFELLNGKRDDRPSYAELLRAVWRKVGLTKVPDDVHSLEASLFNLFASHHILSINNMQKQNLAEQACGALAAQVGGLSSSNSWPPFAYSLMKIALLRRKLESEGRIPPLKEGRIQPISDVDQEKRKLGAEIALTSEDGNPLAIFQTVPEPKNVIWHSRGNTGDILKYLGSVAAVLEPFNSANAILSKGHYYRSNLPLSKNKMGNFVGSALGHKGQVPLYKASLVAVGGPAALLILAQQISEQQRWENIERNLTEIKTAVEGVVKFQKDERRASLTGSIRYFQQISSSILAGELADEMLHGIERHEAELIRIQDHITEDIKSKIGALESIKNDGWLSSSKFMKALEDAIAPIEMLHTEMRLCLRARACGLQLLYAYPGREHRKNTRRQDILAGIAHWGPSGPGGQEFDSTLREKAKLTSSYDNKMSILQKGHDSLSTTEEYESYIRSNLNMMLANGSDESSTIAIEFKVEGSEVVGFRTV